MSIRDSLHRLQQRLSRQKPLVEIGISKANLLHNLRTYQNDYPDMKIAPVLKSNAYGHDLGLIARLLDTEDIAFFMVDSLYEARRLRSAGIRSRIVVMGYVRPIDIATSKLRDIDFGIVDFVQLKELIPLLTRPTRLHLKLDTGMHRQGLVPRDLDEVIEVLRSNEHAHVVGVGSHFADADNPDPAFTRGQVEVWLAGLEKLEAFFPTMEFRHIAATKGVRFGHDARTNVARIGIGLYGFDTSPDGSTKLKHVLEARSIISSIREVPEGDSVGYNATFTAPRPLRVATVPMGYFEGVDRRLSSKGMMLVAGKHCPIVGRVSMNMTSINVTNVPEAKQGDCVVVISRDASHPNSIVNIAKLASTPEYRETSYVLLVHIPQHLRRVVE